MRLVPLLIVALLATASGADAQRPASTGETAAVLTAHRAWWRAFTVGDTAKTAALTLPTFTLTLSTGETFDRAGAVRSAAVRGDSSLVRLDWSEESVRLAGSSAVVTSRMHERVGQMEGQYRYLTVLQRTPGGWRVAAAQSTRIPAPSPSVVLPQALLREYEGQYRVPSGAFLRVAARDSLLALATPDGREQLLAPVGDAVFEIRTSRARFDVVRFVFERDASGRVTRLTRLSPAGVLSFARAP